MFNVKPSTFVLGIALASTPIFSTWEGLSFIPQVLMVVAGLCAIRQLEIQRLHPGIVMHAILAVFFGLTLVLAEHSAVISLYLTYVKLVLACMLCCFVVQRKEDLQFVLACFVIACPLAFIINYQDITSVAQQADVAARRGISADRFDGTFGNANIAGMYATMVTAAVGVLVVSMRSRLKYLMLAVLIPAIMIAVHSGSRKAMLGLVLVAALAGLAYLMRRPNWSFGHLIKAAVVSGAIVVIGFVLAFVVNPHSDRFAILTGGTAHRDNSFVARSIMFSVGMDMWAKSPIWGHGYDAFRWKSGTGRYSHSTVSEMAANGGLIGLVLWWGGGLLLVWHLWRIIKHTMDPQERHFRLMVLAILVVFGFFALFAVMHADRTALPMMGCIAGYVQYLRRNEALAYGYPDYGYSLPTAAYNY